MCQLTVANLNNIEYNRLYLAVQMTLNSKDHQDGAGFWNGVKYYKQKTMPRLNYNFGTNLSAIITTPYPAFGHVRKASLIKGQKIVSPENSHPFVGERFILAHNGTLDPKEYKMWSEFPTVEIDTALFASFLEKNAKQNPDKLFLDLLKSTYNDFSGKFAFIITDRKTDTNYIIRGFTASLFKYDVEICRKKKDGSEEVINTGFVINTEKDDLQAGIILFSNLLQTIYGVYVKYDDARFSELEKETAFKLSGNTLEKIGEIKETYKTYSTVPVKVEKIDDVEYEVAQKLKNFVRLGEFP